MKRKIIVLSMICLIFISVFYGCDSNEKAMNNNLNEVSENTSSANEEDGVENEESVTEQEPTYGDFDGFLWEVKNGDATVYMFGSIHMADKALYPFSEKVEKAFESADILGVEADVSDGNAAAALMPLMLYEGEDELYNHLSEEGIENFEIACEELGLSPQMFKKMRIWVAGSNVLQMQLMQSKYSGQTGVDMYFLNKAKATDKEIIALEGLEYQINLINGFTDEEQEATFFTFGTIEESISDFEKLYNLYLSGDEEEMTAFLFDQESDITSSKEVEDKMLRDRNIGMAEKIDEYLQTDKTYFIVVGLAHYLGDDSVLKYLMENGYTIERK